MKIRSYRNEYDNFDDWEWQKWTKWDLCHECSDDVFEYFRVLAINRAEGESK